MDNKVGFKGMNYDASLSHLSSKLSFSVSDLPETHLQLSSSVWLASRTSCRVATFSIGTLYFPFGSLSAVVGEKMRIQL